MYRITDTRVILRQSCPRSRRQLHQHPQRRHRYRGNNSIGIDYVQTDDLAQANDDYTGWGVGFVHSIPGPRVQLFAGYRNHDLDRPGTGLQDIDQFNVGARVQF